MAFKSSSKNNYLWNQKDDSFITFIFSGVTPATSIGTQININSLNIDMSSKKLDEDSQCLVLDREIKEHGLVLGSGQVDKDLLSKVVKNFFKADRRKYKGKHKNSPMVIKFYD